MNELIEKIILYQAKNGLTQAEVAQKCKIDLSYLNKIMNGKRNPSRVVITKILLIVGDNNG